MPSGSLAFRDKCKIHYYYDTVVRKRLITRMEKMTTLVILNLNEQNNHLQLACRWQSDNDFLP